MEEFNDAAVSGADHIETRPGFTAMLAYIAQSFPEARLAPFDDPFAFAQVQAFNSYLCSTVHVAHAHRVRGTRWADDPTTIEAIIASCGTATPISIRDRAIILLLARLGLRAGKGTTGQTL